MSDLIQRQTALPEHIIQFGRFLRERKYRCGIQEERDALLALSHFTPAKPEAFRLMLQAIFAKNKDQFLRFRELFNQYWTELSKAEDAKEARQAEQGDPPKPKPSAPSLQELKDWLFKGQTSETGEIASFSAVEIFARKDFSSFNDRELEEVRQVIRQLARLLDRHQHRRFIRSARPKWIDLRRSIRKNISRGAEIEYFLFKKRKPSKLHITLFCDVSKSMDLYARFLIQFMYSFHQVSARVETFVFSTSLTHISPALKNRDFEDSLLHLGDLVPDWSGGTNIGKALGSYQRDYGRKYLDRKTVAILLSDGWDLGDPEQLAGQLRYIKKVARRLIWINPLAGKPGFKPETEGMKAALPYIDHLTSAHNLESLVELVRYIGKKT